MEKRWHWMFWGLFCWTNKSSVPNLGEAIEFHECGKVAWENFTFYKFLDARNAKVDFYAWRSSVPLSLSNAGWAELEKNSMANLARLLSGSKSYRYRMEPNEGLHRARIPSLTWLEGAFVWWASYDFKKAWNSVTPENLVGLVMSITQRCQAVIDTNGGYTKGWCLAIDGVF